MQTIIVTNILTGKREEFHGEYDRIIDFLQDEFPGGFDLPTAVYLDKELIEPVDYDRKIVGNLIIIQSPAAALIGLTGMMATLFNAAVLMALNFLVGMLFRPKENKQDQKNPDPVYSLTSRQNSARPGYPVPVGWGTFKTIPDYVEPVFTRYEHNEEFTYFLVAIGQGDYDINKVMFGDLDLTESENVLWKRLGPGDFGNISDAVGFGPTGSTAPPPNPWRELDIEENFIYEDHNNNYYAHLAGYAPFRIIGMNDFGYKGETYRPGRQIDEPSGKIYGGTTYWAIEWLWDQQASNNNPAPMGTEKYYPRTYTLPTPMNYELKYNKWIGARWKIKPGAMMLEFDIEYARGLYHMHGSGDITKAQNAVYIRFLNDYGHILGEAEFHHASADINPKRFTHRIHIPHGATHIEFRAQNDPASTGMAIQVLPTLRRVKLIYEQGDVRHWGHITLLFACVRATNAISAQAQQYLSAWVRRTDVGNSVADVVTDIYSNPVYGARLDHHDLIIMDGRDENVNGAISERGIVFDKMNEVATAQGYHVFYDKQHLTLRKDKPTPFPVMVFNEQNIIKGSFSLAYHFDEMVHKNDSVVVTWNAANDWKLTEFRYPATGTFPLRVNLFGVTRRDKAEKMAQYLYANEKIRRRTVKFQTDVQGFILKFMDRIRITHTAAGDLVGWIEEVGRDKLFLSEDVTGVTTLTVRGNSGEVVTLHGHGQGKVFTTPDTIPDTASVFSAGVGIDYLVTKVTYEGSDNGIMSVEAVEYSDAIYPKGW